MVENFAELEQNVMALFNDGAYQQVLDVLAANEATFPQEIGFNYYLRMCAAARLGDTAQACDLLEAALGHDLWFTEEVLRESPSLVPLNGHERFEQLITASREKMAGSRKEWVVKTAVPHTQPPYPLLLALHGNGSSVDAEFGRWETAVSSGRLVVAPQSSYSMLPGRYYWTSVETAVEEVNKHLDELGRQYAIGYENVVVGGFSMGGDVALWLALNQAIPVNRFLLVGPGGPHVNEPDSWQPLISQAKSHNVSGLVLMSEDDPYVNQEHIRELVGLLNKGGIHCELAVYQGLAHEYPPDFSEKLASLLEKHPA